MLSGSENVTPDIITDGVEILLMFEYIGAEPKPKPRATLVKVVARLLIYAGPEMFIT
jgi:hypothetical protein